MKRLLTILFLFFFVEGNSQLVSFIYHGDTVFAYNPLTKDSFKVRNFSKSEVGLSNVDNTSDLNKPVSNQQLNFLSQLTNDSSLFAASENDQSVKLRQFRDDPSVREIMFANGDIVINDTINLAGKILVFRNGSKIKGTGTLSNFIVIASPLQQIFDTTLKVSHLNNPTIEVSWFGAKADCQLQNEFGTTNNWKAFRNALNSMFEYNGTDPFDYFYTKKLHIQSGNNKSYYISDSIIVSGNVEIYGDGQQSTILNWRRGVKGFILPTTSYPAGVYTTIQQARRCYLHDFTMSGYKGAIGFYPGYFDSTSHGLVLYGGEHDIERVCIQGWRGHGLYIFGGNENYIANVQSEYNGGSGFYMTTADGNANTFVMCKASKNGAAGFFDSSFLGNTFIGCSTTSNASDNPYQQSIVLNRDTTMSYSAILPSKNIEPEHTPGWQNYWRATLSIGYFNHAWDSTVYYRPGGSMVFFGANQIGVAIGCYSEGDQYAGNNASNTMVIGGFQAGMDNATIKNGSYPLFQAVYASNRQNLNVFDKVYSVLNGVNKTIGWFDDGKANTKGWRYDTTSTSQAIDFVDGGGVSGVKLVYKNGIGDASSAGRTSFPQFGGYYAAFPTAGIWLGKFGGGQIRNLCMSDTLVGKGKWAAGDFILNTGTDSTIIGWRCKTSGDFAISPPTFSTIQTNVPTKMTTTQRNAIISPQEGLMIYDTSLHKLFVWDGTLWEAAW